MLLGSGVRSRSSGDSETGDYFIYSSHFPTPHTPHPTPHTPHPTPHTPHPTPHTLPPRKTFSADPK
ncbi:MAG: hypothetical protein O9295_18085 [Microcystis sp. LE18-22.4A]|nr:hypothetical protein [Microcystis sp. LE18-22.4A]